MAIAVVKADNWLRKTFLFASSIGGAIVLWGCSTNIFQPSDLNWKTYKNSRYSFEFPYPSNWHILPSASDGVVLVAPKDNSIKIRAWANKNLPGLKTSIQQNREPIQTNFQTVQGVKGMLIVEANQGTNVMKLTITQGNIQYYWQGESNSQEFTKNYKLFYYIAQAYKIRQ